MHLLGAHTQERAVDTRLEALRPGREPELGGAPQDLGEAGVPLEPLGLGRVGARDIEPVDKLGDRPLVDGVLAEDR